MVSPVSIPMWGGKMKTFGRNVFTLAAIPCFLFFITTPLMAEFQFPLKSLSPITTPPGEQHVRFGLGYNKGERLLFQTVDKNRKVYELPSFDVSLGVSSNVELLFSYPLLLLEQEGQQSNYGSGDLTITGVFRLFRLGTIFPDCAFNIAVKLPNADDVKEFGTDETDFFIGGILSRKIGKGKLLINLEFAILGDPTAGATSQDDVLMYTLGSVYPIHENLSVLIEISGTEFSDTTNDRRFLRGGIAYTWKKVLFDVGGAAGLTDQSGDYQVTLGGSITFGTAIQNPECLR